MSTSMSTSSPPSRASLLMVEREPKQSRPRRRSLTSALQNAESFTFESEQENHIRRTAKAELEL